MKKLRRVKYVCRLLLCVPLLLTACGRDTESDGGGRPDKDAVSGENIVPDNAHNIAQEREWVYVPEVFTVGDERADYERMQPVGDAFCYVLQGDTADGAKNICRYSLTDRELKSRAG